MHWIMAHQESNTPTQPRGTIRGSRVVIALFRLLFVDISIFLLTALWVSTILWKWYHDEYLLPFLPLVNFEIPREHTYYYRYCTHNDTSTRNSMDLVVETPEDAIDSMLRHGVAVFPDLLSQETIQEFRQYIVDANKVVQNIDHAIEAENRHTWGLLVDTPIVQKATRELFTNTKFRDTLAAIAGDEPMVLEFNHITSKYGAKKQHVHQDITWGTPLRFARQYVPHYSFFLPLQNTTARMGASRICPGTHVCGDGHFLFCQQTSFQLFEDYQHWPAGWGMLYDQQLTHNGEAHTDPEAPDRVQVIMTFTPRPRQEGPTTLNTRFLAEGGADFQDWSQWGHTYSDYADAKHRMMEPWKILKSLGVFKMPGTLWGYDYIQQSLGRISNDQAGWNREDYDLFRERGGFWWLPEWLHGDVSDENDGPLSWSEFAVSTLEKCKQFFFKCLVAWAATIISIYATVGAFSGEKSPKAIGRILMRIVVIVAINGWLAHLISKNVERGVWGRMVKKQALYQVTGRRGFYKLPSTLPTEFDILVPDDFQSEYLHIMNQFLDKVQPGNVAFLAMAKSEASGYRGLSTTLQRQLRRDLISWSRAEYRRILVKNTLGEWAEATSDTVDWFCHKELTKASHSFIANIVKWTDYLLAETKYGYWRDTALHIYHIPQMLRRLQNLILEYDNLSPDSRLVAYGTSPARPSPMSIHSKLTILSDRKSTTSKISVENYSILALEKSTEPFPGAWTNVGDLVEARYQTKSDHWFRAFVRGTDALEGVWHVVYEDGEPDYELCRRCIRPYVPYKVGDLVQWVDDSWEDEYQARIVAVNPGERYDLEFVEEEEISGGVMNVPALKLHRYEPEVQEIKVGSFVRVRDDDDDGFDTVAIITEVFDDGYAAIDDDSIVYDFIDAEDVEFDYRWYKIQ